MDILQQEHSVNAAFSKQSPIFDAIDDSSGIHMWMRNRVRGEVLKYIPANATMLELNCGTGLDAVFFAKKGHKVLATDNADGMLEMLGEKIEQLGLQEQLSARKCSFNSLEQLYGKQFDYVFSNFGGLNCAEDLAKVLLDIDKLLKPGGYFTLAIMPVICPWELLTLFRGYFKTAFRRLHKNGVIAYVEGVPFKCYYYNPSYVIGTLKGLFALKALKGLSVVVPPPFIEGFKERHPKLFSRLEKIENRIWDKAPFNRWCDHYVITMQKNY